MPAHIQLADADGETHIALEWRANSFALACSGADVDVTWDGFPRDVTCEECP
jgi:hypothetical protein